MIGGYLDLCFDTDSDGDDDTCANLEVGRNLTINDNGVLDIWSGVTAAVPAPSTEPVPANDNSSTVTFNGSSSATLYIGDITTYRNDLTGYIDPEGNQAYERWEHPFYNLVIDKPGDTLFLAAKYCSVQGGNNFRTSGGGKNVASWRNNIFKVTNEFTLTQNSVLNQIDQSVNTVG